MKEIKYIILYCVCENFCDSILFRFQFRYGKKLRFLRFRFRNTAEDLEPSIGIFSCRNQHQAKLHKKTWGKIINIPSFSKLGYLTVLTTKVKDSDLARNTYCNAMKTLWSNNITRQISYYSICFQLFNPYRYFRFVVVIAIMFPCKNLNLPPDTENDY
jgi:hypothetical protein